MPSQRKGWDYVSTVSRKMHARDAAIAD